MISKHLLLTSLLLLLCSGRVSHAQWNLDFRQQMEIPNIVNMESTDSHFYVLSDSEGLVVFRAHSDSMQWLYTSTGMQQRGHRLDSDIRFAYLYGDGRRLTIIEPTSVLGVYSSTVLPGNPRSVQRVGNHLYMALGEAGLGKLSLESPEQVDSGVDLLDRGRFRDREVAWLTTDQHQVLYVLSGRDNLDIYRISEDGENIMHEDWVEINRPVQKLFLTDDELIGADGNGNIFLINASGGTQMLGSVENTVDKLRLWNGRLVIRTENGDLWSGPFRGDVQKHSTDARAGNYFTITENRLWISEFNQVSPVIPPQAGPVQSAGTTGGALRLKEIGDITLPFPRPLILPIELEAGPAGHEISFSYEATFNNARIRGNTFYWQPTATQTGRHHVGITASSSGGQTDRVEFTVDLRPFNSPPRFSPARPVSIPVGEAYQFRINAVDPDGPNPDLIRYLGVDLPEGGRLDEKTGLFTWTPTIRQVGTTTFQVIATDQYGTAASQNFEIRVIELED